MRFTIRDLLWLAALMAVCVAWWVDHRSVAIQHINDGQKISKLAGELDATRDALREDENVIKFFDNRGVDSLKNFYPVIKHPQQ
jgi:hypothetical protein